MKQSLFDTASSLKKVEVKIDGKTIPNEDFVEIELHWEHDSFEVQGIMILKDNTDLNSFFVNWDRKIVNVFVTDLLGENFSRDFYIVKLSEAKGEKANDKMLEISLVDKLSFELKNTYYSKSYSGKTLSQIIDDIWSTFKFDDLYDKKYIQKQFSQTKEVYDGIVVPQDRSLYDFFAFQLDQEGYVWFQQKDAICIKSVREVLPAALQADKSKDFTEDVENPNYGFKILEFSGNYMNFYESLKLPASTNYFYNYDEKMMKTIGNNIEDIYDSLKSANIDEKYIQPTKGKRFALAEKNLNCDNVLLDTYLHYMENVKLEIFVPGNSKGNKLYEKRNAFFKGSSLHQEGHSEGNTKLQGEFLVFSIYDKILGDKMISKINICRLNNTTSFAQKPATAATTAAPTATTAPSIVPTPAVTPAAVVPPVTQPSGATLAAAATGTTNTAAITGNSVASSLTSTASLAAAAESNSAVLSSVSSVASTSLASVGNSLNSASTSITGAIGTISAGGTPDVSALSSSLTSSLGGAVTSIQTSAIGNLSGISAQVGAFAGDVVHLPDMSKIINSVTSDNFNLSSLNLSSITDLKNLQSQITAIQPAIKSAEATLASIGNATGINTTTLNNLANSLTSTASSLVGKNYTDAVKVLNAVSTNVSTAIMLTPKVVPSYTIAADLSKLQAIQTTQSSQTA